MTSALAYAMREGEIHVFEPHPKVYGLLEENIDRLSDEVKTITVIRAEKALGRKKGVETLHVPQDWSGNYGLASLRRRANSKAIEVEVGRLDEEVEGPIQLLKLDVEGHEDAVLRGARSLLARNEIRHILFEDHNFENSSVVERLMEAGYTIFGIQKQLRGPYLASPTSSGGYNFIATIDVEECRTQFREKGWMSLRGS
jgi:FkbM family methyltransferase